MEPQETTPKQQDRPAITRRKALQRAGAGLTALGMATATEGLHSVGAAGRQAGRSLRTSASFDWKRFSGQSLNVLFVNHPWQKAVTPLIPQFEKLTGINVHLTVMPESTYYNRTLLGLGAHPAPFDVFFQDLVDFGYNAWQNGWVEALDGYLSDTTLTDAASYQVEDFYPKFLAGFRLPTSTGQLYGIPITVETYFIFYRKDIFKKYGINAAQLKTLDDWLAAVEGLAPKLRSEHMYAAAIRGVPASLIDQFDAMALDCWGSHPYIERRLNFFDQKWQPQFTDPHVVKALNAWARVEKVSPPGITAFDWYNCTSQFQQGRVATFWFDASLFASIFEDPKVSRVAGNVGYAMVPAGAPGQAPKTAFWNWGLGIPKNAQHKQVAWYFIQWATSNQIDLQTAPKTFAPVRQSTWHNEALVRQFPPGFAPAVAFALDHADDADILFKGADQIGIKIGDAITSIYQGAAPETAAQKLQDQAMTIVKAAGYRK